MVQREITKQRDINTGKFDTNVEFNDERDYMRRATDRGDKAIELIDGFLVERRGKNRRKTDRS